MSDINAIFQSRESANTNVIATAEDVNAFFKATSVGTDGTTYRVCRNDTFIALQLALHLNVPVHMNATTKKCFLQKESVDSMVVQLNEAFKPA